MKTIMNMTLLVAALLTAAAHACSAATPDRVKTANGVVDIAVRVFRHTSRQVRDSDGHTHPGDPHEARQALLTITTDDGAEGHCLGPVEVLRPHLINGFVRHVLIGQDPFDRER